MFSNAAQVWDRYQILCDRCPLCAWNCSRQCWWKSLKHLKQYAGFCFSQPHCCIYQNVNNNLYFITETANWPFHVHIAVLQSNMECLNYITVYMIRFYIIKSNNVLTMWSWYTCLKDVLVWLRRYKLFLMCGSKSNIAIGRL